MLQRFALSELLRVTTLSIAMSVCAANTATAVDPARPPLAVAPFDARQAKAHQTAWARHLKRDVTFTNSIGMKFVLIPPGEFKMGSPASEAERDQDEAQHIVRITEPFFISMTEVTQSQYEKLMKENPSRTNPNRKEEKSLIVVPPPPPELNPPDPLKLQGVDTRDFPVEWVSWDAACRFCNALAIHDQPGKAQHSLPKWEYSLPTEAEWEFAARAGSETAFPWGNVCNGGEGQFQFDPNVINLHRPVKVGSYPANAFGLNDMHGNVSEWCLDWYAKDYYGKSRKVNPAGPPVSDIVSFPSKGARVTRGGCYATAPAQTRSADRHFSNEISAGSHLGFRVVATPFKTPPLTLERRYVIDARDPLRLKKQ